MEWPAGLTEDDVSWLRENLELATSTLEEEHGTTVQASGMRGVREEVQPYWATWDGRSVLPRWLTEGLGATLEEYYREIYQAYQRQYTKAEGNPDSFRLCLEHCDTLNQLEEQARERFWSLPDTAGGKPELRGVHGVREDVREREVVRQTSKQREVYTYRNWAGTVRRDVVR